ncbi:MAG: tetratricopeptide repeat protein [Marinoscillum sp.]|uniref:tetratricopeptide repeat protein n=1 Tax=Marinoscillum sp. TaxID=2024838 RepID=UPI0032F28A5D
MNTDRIRQLEKFMEDDPNDPFPKYALALEYLQTNKEKSAQLFEELLKNHSKYIGTYYHAAALFSELDDRKRAEQIYLTGIEMATQLNEAHALKELRSAYMNFQFEE